MKLGVLRRCLPVLLALAACDNVFGVLPVSEPVADTPVPIDTFATEGLVAYFPMDLATSEGTPDIVNAHVTSCRGACPVVTEGVYGSALDFTASGELYMAPSADLDGVAAFSVSAWFNLQNAPQPGSPVCVASKLIDGAVNNVWQICVDNSKHANFYSDNKGVFDYAYHPIEITIGTWFHVVIVWNGTTKSIYVNGGVGGAEPSSMTMGTARIVIGGDLDAAPKSHFVGWIDELRIYDRALSGSEITALASRP